MKNQKFAYLFLIWCKRCLKGLKLLLIKKTWYVLHGECLKTMLFKPRRKGPPMAWSALSQAEIEKPLEVQRLQFIIRNIPTTLHCLWSERKNSAFYGFECGKTKNSVIAYFYTPFRYLWSRLLLIFGIFCCYLYSRVATNRGRLLLQKFRYFWKFYLIEGRISSKIKMHFNQFG